MTKSWKRTSALMRAGEADEVVGAALYGFNLPTYLTTPFDLEVARLRVSGCPRTADY